MKTVYVVGCTRSGLSLVMQMLDAGGYPCIGSFPAFEEYVLGEIPWDKVVGNAVKVVDTDRQLPPKRIRAKVIRLHRNPNEQAKSTNKFLSLVQGFPPLEIRRLKASYVSAYKRIDSWFKSFSVLHIHFEDLLEDPKVSAERINTFLETEGDLNLERMASAVLKRSPSCYEGLLELSLMNRK